MFATSFRRALISSSASWIYATPTSVMFAGDSRMANSVGQTDTAGAYTITSGLANGYGGRLMNVTNNKLLQTRRSDYGVGSTTSRCLELRINSTSNATSGNPAFADTGVAADANYNSNSTAEYSPVSDPSNVVALMISTNDPSSAYYSTAPTPIVSMQRIANILDALKPKTVFVANETPRGLASTQHESHAVVSNAFTLTNGATLDSVQCLINKVTGAFYTKVGSSPAIGQYTVDATGHVAFNASDTIATALVSYSWTASATSSYLLTMHNWLQSKSPAPFVDPVSGASYAIAGALFNRPWCVKWDTWGAITDPATLAGGTGTYRALPGALDSLALHPSEYGAHLVGNVFKTAFNATFPTASSKAPAPSKNNWTMGTGNGAAKTFSGTMPGVMAAPVTPGSITVAAGASVVGTDDGAGNITGSGVTSGTINYATGAISVTFTTAPANTLPIIVSLDFANLLANPLMDYAQGTVASTGGMTGNVPKSWTCVAGSTTGVTITCASTTDSLGNPAIEFDIAGTPAATVTITLTNLLSAAILNSSRLNPSNPDEVRAGCRVAILAGADGHLCGIGGALVRANLGTSVAVVPPGFSSSCTVFHADANVATTGFWYSDLDLFETNEAYVYTAPLSTNGMTISQASMSVVITLNIGIYCSAKIIVSQAQFEVVPAI